MLSLHQTLFILLHLVAACNALVLADPSLTNAERLRRGLALKVPVLRRGTRTRQDISPSNLPTSWTGYVQVSTSTGIVGFLALGGRFTLDPLNAMQIKFTVSSGSGLEVTCVAGCSAANQQHVGLGTTTEGGIATVFVIAASTPRTGIVTNIGVPARLETPVWSFNAVSGSLGLTFTSGTGLSYSNVRISSDGTKLNVAPNNLLSGTTAATIRFIPI
ncbi:hypothetical protein DL96DRAFT_1681296 [Flagelloscypha sp. PMI_526]|nr:hypothetical protein DL96DRAFT_1681296 [Flagelloscypha sp. PMI_526]